MNQMNNNSIRNHKCFRSNGVRIIEFWLKKLDRTYQLL